MAAAEGEALPVVLDVGSGLTKVGFAEAEQPAVVFPTVVGKPNKQQVHLGHQGSDRYVGGDAFLKQAILSLIPPVVKGLPDLSAHREEFEEVVAHGLRLSGACPVGAPTADIHLGRPVLLSESPQCTSSLRAHVGEVLFESFDTPAVWCGLSSAFALFASGRTSGVVLELGHGHSHAVPFLEGHAVPRSRWRPTELTGRAQDDYLSDLVREAGRQGDDLMHQQYLARMHHFAKVKEQLCYVAEDYDYTLSDAQMRPDELQGTYALPDGSEIALVEPRVKVGELLFQPELLFGDAKGTGLRQRQPVHQTLLQSIQACHEDLQSRLVNNIVLSGGVSLMPGFESRMRLEINRWFNATEDGQQARRRMGLSRAVTLVPRAPPPPGVATCTQVWRGGAILGRLPSFRQLCVTRADYLEDGERFFLRNEIAPTAAG